MLRSPGETLQLFERWADVYGASVEGGILEGYDQSLADAAGLVPVSPGMQVLDVGIGTGAFGGLLAGRGARVHGVDISPKMLAVCAASHPDFELTEGSFLPIPYGNGSFDAVVASFAFHEVVPAERPAACREIARVLRPGGYVCLLDVSFASAAARAEARRVIGPRWDDTEEYPLVWELDSLLREAGFAAVFWRQTGPCHWAVLGRLPAEPGRLARVETERLELFPAPLELVQAVAEGRREGIDLPAAVPAEWPEADLRDFLPTYAVMLAEDPDGACWGVWVMVEKSSRTVIGDIGFKGSPDEEGHVEIGYSLLPAWRRQGYAAEAATALVGWAFAQPEVTAVLAECLQENAASARVLEKAGLHRIGVAGDLVKWIRTR